MSTSGWSTRVSTQPQKIAIRMPALTRLITPTEPQPHALALLRPNSRLASAAESSAAPSQSTRASGRVSSCGT